MKDGPHPAHTFHRVVRSFLPPWIGADQCLWPTLYSGDYDWYLWARPLKGLYLLPRLLQAWAAIFNKFDNPDGETTQSIADTSEGGEACWAPPCEGDRYVGETVLDTPDQSNHLLNPTMGPDSSARRTKELPERAPPELLVHIVKDRK